MRTKSPTYLDKDGNFVGRVRLPDGKVSRFKQKAPEHLVSREERVRWARMMMKNLRADASRAETERYLERIQLRRTGTTIGDVIERVLSKESQVRKNPYDQSCQAGCLRRVVAHALDLWLPGFPTGRGIHKGMRVPNAAKIDALPLTVLNADLVKRYFADKLGVDRINWLQVYDGALGINSILRHARSCFMGKTRQIKLAGLELPDLTGFMELSLKQGEGKPEPLNAAQFDAMVSHFDGLRLTQPDMWLVNLVVRQTGLRSLSSAMQIHKDWLRKLNDGYWLSVTGKTRYTIPITDTLANEILRCDGFLFPASTRKTLLSQHTEILKGIIGAGIGGQVNHRLRDTVASACWSWLGLEAAQEALGHKSPQMTLSAYAARMDVSETMKHELRAWPRVLPQNVVTMRVA